MTHTPHEPADDSPRADLRQLASRPALVIAVSAVLTALVTVVVLIAEPADVDILGVVGLAATTWALALALVIYLLTAQDTRHVLDEIGDLREQLSAALADPEAEAEAGSGSDPTPVEAALPGPTSDAGTERRDGTDQSGDRPARRDVQHGRTHPGEARDRPERGDRAATFYRSGTGTALEDRVPAEYVAAWRATTGRDPAQVARAWTRGHAGAAPWVLQSADGSMWSVFADAGGTPSVIRLDTGRQRPRRRDDGRR